MLTHSPAKLLVVDDNEANRYALVRSLRQAGHQVLEAATAQKGLRLAADEQPDLVLLDVQLPDASGIKVCRELKCDPKTASIPVIQMSAYFTDTEDRIEGLDSGADVYLATPFDVRELLTRVGALVRSAKAESALRKAEQQFRSLFTSMGEAFILQEAIFGPEGNIVDFRFIAVNPAFEAQTGLRNVIGRTMHQVMPATETRWIQTFAEVVQTGRSLRFEDRVASLDRWFNVLAYRPGSEESNQVAVLCIDITERKEMEEAVRRSDQQLRLAIDAAFWISFEWDIQNSQVWRSVSKEPALGPTIPGAPDTFEHVCALVHPEDREGFIANINAALQDEQGRYQNHFRLCRPDGTVAWLSEQGRVERDSQGRPTRLIGFSQEVTEREKAQGLLRQALDKAEFEKQRLSAVLEALPAGIAIADLTGKVTHFNAALNRIWGSPPIPDSVEGYRRWRGWWPETGEPLTAQDWTMSKVLSTGQAVAGDVIEIEKFDGSGRSTIINAAAPLRDATGKLIGGVVAVVNISEQKRAEAALKRAEEQLREQAQNLERIVEERTAKLRETVADLERFSYSISHDLRAPLRAMNSFSTFLLEEYGDRLDSTATDYLHRITAAAQRLDELIRDVLTYSQVAKADLTLVPVDLDHLIRQVIGSYPQLHEENVKIEVVNHLLPVLGSVALLTQCVSNLLGNASKFVAPRTTPTVRVWTEQHEGWVRLSVRDNGIGIHPASLDRIWRLFERDHHRRDYSGTGIGLSIVKRAVERMGGRVGVESEPGKGSTFWLELKGP